MLTPLQGQVASVVAGLAQAEDFALAGGAALIARGDVQRQTRDLDFFGLTPAAVDRLVPAVDRALQEAGLIVRHIQVGPGFARLIVESGDDSTELDFGPTPGSSRPNLPSRRRCSAARSSQSTRSVDKVLAVFGRAEARDFVDLAAVEARYGLDRLFELAARKDHGFTRDLFAEMAGRFSRLRPDEFGLDPVQYEQLERTVLEWQERARRG